MIFQPFEFGQILIGGPPLPQFKQGSFRVVVKVWSKIGFECLEQSCLGCKEVTPEHPLELAQHGTIHVEQCDGDMLLIWGIVIIKKLRDLKDPFHEVMAIDAGNLEFKVMVMVIMGGCGWWW